MKRIYFLRAWHTKVGWKDALLIHTPISQVRELSKKLHKVMYLGYIEVPNDTKPSYDLMRFVWPISITQLIVCGETQLLLNNKYRGMLYK